MNRNVDFRGFFLGGERGGRGRDGCAWLKIQIFFFTLACAVPRVNGVLGAIARRMASVLQRYVPALYLVVDKEGADFVGREAASTAVDGEGMQARICVQNVKGAASLA